MSADEKDSSEDSPVRGPQVPSGHTVVAVVLQTYGQIALLKRSQSTSHDRGMWHCVTGFVDAGNSPQAQAIHELREETGVEGEDVLAVNKGRELLLSDEGGRLWRVHTFVVTTNGKALCLNWENDSYFWTTRESVKFVADRVKWLDAVLDATE